MIEAPVDTQRSLSARATSGLGWSSLSYLTQGVGQILVVAVLARYVTADDFGVISATLLVVGFGKLFTQSIVGPALVQRASLEHRHLVTAIRLAVVSGLAMAVLTVATAPLVGRVFRFDHITAVLIALSLTFVLQAPSVVSEAMLQRQMRFRELAIADAASFLIGYCLLGVGLALAGFGVWALVGASLAQAAIDSVLLIWFYRPQVRGRVDREALHDIVHFGTGFTAGKVFNYAAGQGDYFVIGRWMSSSQLGLYSRAYQLVAMPAMLVGQVLDRVMFPVMASFQHDRPRLAQTYRRAVALIAMLMVPASVLMVILSSEIVQVLLGGRWHDVAGPLRILAVGLLGRTGYKISDSLARSTGMVYRRAWRQAIYAALVVGGSLVGRHWGIEGVAWGVLGAITINYFAMAALSISSTGLPWRTFAGAHVRGLILGVCVAALCWPTAQFLRTQDVAAWLVIAIASAFSVGLVGLGAQRNPNLVLGDDALWMIDRIRKASHG
jgi:O-antigen/teichoic acid export membrane protein